jgi:RNA polymerase sigma-54 factor
MKITQNLSTQQVMKLQQALHPKLIQMLKTFNYTYPDLVNKIKNEAEENVALEIIQNDQLSDTYLRSKKDNSNFMGNQDISEYAKDNKDNIRIYDYVLSQLDIEHLNKKDHQIALDLIDDLDDRGYITNYDQIKEPIKTKHQVKDRKVHDILKIIQNFEPEGVGARSLKECLLIQLKSHQFENQLLESFIQKIITYHLEQLSEKKYDQIAKTLKIEPEGVMAVEEFIKSNLNPNPGANFITKKFSEYVIPSFEVAFDSNEISITNLEQKQGIQIQISSHYLKMLENPDLDQETKEFLTQKIAAAKELVNNLNKRYENLEKLARFIVEKQSLFIKKGALYLEPLLQKNIAETLNITPSTVSRIVASKYIQTPHGLFSLKQLCPRNHFGKTAERLKLIIKDLIADHPTLSDENISLLLKVDGIDIARRTVTKYRHLIGVESSFKRS